jgi:hypothetical protein
MVIEYRDPIVLAPLKEYLKPAGFEGTTIGRWKSCQR